MPLTSSHLLIRTISRPFEPDDVERAVNKEKCKGYILPQYASFGSALGCAEYVDIAP